MLKWHVGDVTVTAIVETVVWLPGTILFPGSSVDELHEIDWLGSNFVNDEGFVPLSIHALVVETAGNRIIIDTCFGNDKPRREAGNMLNTDFLARLEQAGFGRESVDTVLCTHMHLDHVGWNTIFENGKWMPTFPKARYLFGRQELDFLKSESQDGDAQAIFGDSIAPILEAGLADLVETDHRICAEVTLIPTPGHTPGHVSVEISSRGQRALITGDVAHHPCQIARPDWSAYVDHDPDLSVTTRKAVFERAADDQTLVIGTHFAEPTAGRIVRDGHALKFIC